MSIFQKQLPRNVKFSAANSFTTTSTTKVDVTSIFVNDFVCGGGPVVLSIASTETSDAGNVTAGVGADSGSPSSSRYAVHFLWVRDGSTVSHHAFKGNVTSVSGSTRADFSFPVAALTQVDLPGAGTFDYKLQMYVQISGDTGIFFNGKMVVYEL